MNTVKHPEFRLNDDLVYLNHAAVAPWPTRTSQAVKSFAEQNSVFGSSNYLQWLDKEQQLKQQLQRLLNAPSTDDIALVKNTSEALSFVAYGLDWNNNDNIVSSNEEFPSNRIVWQSLASQGVEFRQADLHQAQTPEESLFARVDKNTRLITVSSIQFASGIRLDLDVIGKFCKQHKILFCVDAIQSLGAVKFNVQSCQADFVMADGHKWMLGPEGLGVFYSTPTARNRLSLKQFGWHMVKDTHNYENKPWEIHSSAKRFECGSPNMLGIHAYSASLSLLLETGMETVEKLVLENANYLIANIAKLNQLELLTDRHAKLKSGIICFRHKNIANNQLFKHFQSHGVLCALRGQGIRFSPHFYNTQAEFDKALSLIT
jgi:selenocysteine lyase/cysteine desulfurase